MMKPLRRGVALLLAIALSNTTAFSQPAPATRGVGVPVGATLRATLQGAQHTARVGATPVIVLTMPTADDKNSEVVAGSGYAAFQYPFGPDAPRPSNRERTLLVMGRNLPVPSEEPIRLQSADPTIDYAVLSGIPRTPEARAYYGPLITSARDRAMAGLTPDQRDAVIRLDFLLVRAVLLPGVLPGPKSFTLNGAEGSWVLQFGGNTAEINFVRDFGREVEDTTFIFLPEDLRLEVRTRVALPMEQIEVRLGRDGQELTVNGSPALVARRVEGSPKRYRTAPLKIVAEPPGSAATPGRDEVFVKLYDTVTAAINAPEGLLDVRPPYASAQVFRTPGEVRGLYKDALAKAARCAGKEIRDWNELPAEEAKRVPSRVILRFEKAKTQPDVLRTWIGPQAGAFGNYVWSPVTHVTDVTLGHVAAMILLRDVFREMLRQHALQMAELKTEAHLAGFKKLIEPHVGDASFPLTSVEVTSPDGGRITLGATYLRMASWVKAKYGLSDALWHAWSRRAFAEGITTYRGLVDQAVRDAAGVDNCDVMGLLELTGAGFGAVVRELSPRLMELHTTGVPPRHQWLPDQVARSAVNEIGALAGTIRVQRAAANADTKLLLAIGLVVAALPAAALQALPALVLTLALDIADVAVNAAFELSELHASNKELAFSQGASGVLGTDRFQDAVRNKKELGMVIANINMSLGGALFSGVAALRAVPSARAGRTFSRAAAQVEREGLEGLRRLPPHQQLEFQRALVDAALAADGVGGNLAKLTEQQRRAVALLDRLSKESAARPPSAPPAVATPPPSPRPTPSPTVVTTIEPPRVPPRSGSLVDNLPAVDVPPPRPGGAIPETPVVPRADAAPPATPVGPRADAPPAAPVVPSADVVPPSAPAGPRADVAPPPPKPIEPDKGTPTVRERRPEPAGDDRPTAGDPPRPPTPPPAAVASVPPRSPDGGAPSRPVAGPSPRGPPAAVPAHAPPLTGAEISREATNLAGRTIDLPGHGRITLGRRVNAGHFGTLYEIDGQPGRLLKVIHNPDGGAQSITRQVTGFDLIKDAPDIPAPRILAHHRGADGQPSYLIVEDLNTGPWKQKNARPATGSLTPQDRAAVGELYDSMAKRGLIWVDGHRNNIFFFDDGGRVRAGVVDHDMILRSADFGQADQFVRDQGALRFLGTPVVMDVLNAGRGGPPLNAKILMDQLFERMYPPRASGGGVGVAGVPAPSAVLAPPPSRPRTPPPAPATPPDSRPPVAATPDTPTPGVHPRRPGDDAPTVIERPRQPGDDAPTVIERPRQPGDDTPTVIERPRQPGDDTPTVIERPPARVPADPIPREPVLFGRASDGSGVDAKYHQNAVASAEHFDGWLAPRSGRPPTPKELAEVTQDMHRIIAEGPAGGNQFRPGNVRGRTRGDLTEYAEKAAVRPAASHYVDRVIEEFPDLGIRKNIGEGLTPLRIDGVPESALPVNRAGGAHRYPPAASSDAYFQRGAALLGDIQKAPNGSPEALAKIVEYYHLMINGQPFMEINNSLFMTQLNYLLRAKGVHAGVSHGYLDLFAYELEYTEFLKVFKLQAEGRLPPPSRYGIGDVMRDDVPPARSAPSLPR